MGLAVAQTHWHPELCTFVCVCERKKEKRAYFAEMLNYSKEVNIIANSTAWVHIQVKIQAIHSVCMSQFYMLTCTCDSSDSINRGCSWLVCDESQFCWTRRHRWTVVQCTWNMYENHIQLYASHRELQISYIMKPQRKSETFNTPVKCDKHMLWRFCNYHKYQHSDLSITFMAHNYPIPLHQSMFPNHYCVICCYSVFEHHSVIRCHWVS